MLPIVPPMTLIIAGIGVPVMYRLKKLYRPAVIAPVSLLLVVFFFAIPFAGIMKKIQTHESQDDLSNYLRRLTEIEDEKEIRTNPLILVYGEEYYQRAPLGFYVLQLQKRGIEVEYKKREELESGDFVCVAEQWAQEYVDARYRYEEVGREGKGIKFLRILGHRE